MSEESAWTLQGALFEQILPLLGGGRTPEEIVAALAPVKPAEVYYVLEYLEKRGHLAERAPEPDGPGDAYWTSLGLDPGPAWVALRSKRVRVRAAGAVQAEPLRRCLEELEVDLTPDEPGLEVVLTDDYLRSELLPWATAAREAGLPFMVVRPSGQVLWLGPLFPGRAPEGEAPRPCFGCLQHRLRRNHQVHEFLRRRNGWAEPLPTGVAALPAAMGAACQMAAVEIAKALAGTPHNLEDRLLSMDTRTWKATSHLLVRYPACPVCGEPPRTPPGPVRLTARQAAPSEGSGHRVTSPEATLERYGHLVSPLIGIVSQVEAPPGTGGVFQVCVGGANGAIPVDSLASFKTSFRHRSAGKGPSLVQAKASALAESLERYASEFTGAEFRIQATFRELGERAIHPNAVMGYSDSQFRERERWNRRGSRFNSVPEPLDPDQAIPWSPVWSLTSERERLLPTQLLYFPGPAAFPAPWPRCCRACSNGNAAGNNLEEAVLQGFLELVERDATAIWWYNRLSRPGVDLASTGQAYYGELAAHYAFLGRNLWALDLTHDLGIPVFAALSGRLDTGRQVLFGLGCSLDPKVALLRAFAELNQFVAGLGPDAATPLGDEETLHWLGTASVDTQPHLAPDPWVPARRLERIPNAATGDLLADIGHCRALVEAKGMEMLVLDLTRADAGMPVAKVLVPGLRHFWARFAPGRLYDVPVAMGWLEKPLAEDELNPTPIFI